MAPTPTHISRLRKISVSFGKFWTRFRTFRHPVDIVTKGALILRDIDILGEMGRDGLAEVGVSLTSLDASLSRKMEPRAAAPHRRLAIIESLAKAGCPVRAMVAPIIPGLNDQELDTLLASAKDAGATTATYIALRLPLEVAGLFEEWLCEHFPDRAQKVMKQVRSLHGGNVYDPSWGRRMRGEGVLADLIARRFEAALKRLGLRRGSSPLRTDLFEPPTRPPQQLSLFGDT